jgi:hypothetical protein
LSFTATESNVTLIDAIRNLSTDNQLALFWFVYKEMGDAVTPAAPGASTVSPDVAEGLFNQVAEMGQEEQLQIQRDLIDRRNSQISRQYGALSDTTKLLFWYLLAQGMSAGSVIQVPAGYELSGSAQQILEQIKALDFNAQITLFRDFVSPMGVDPTQAGVDPKTGL